MNNIPKIKICGISRHIDIEYVNELKPDYIGFIFAKSRRRISPELALTLREKLNPEIKSVGVFVDETVDTIVNLTKSGIIDIIQLHGNEDNDYIHSIREQTDKPIIKAAVIEHPHELEKHLNLTADYLLFDSKGGGTGKPFDWDLIKEVKQPFFLAGGLNCDNIKTAIEKTTPFAVDVSSGVEVDGVKDYDRIKAFIGEIREGRIYAGG